MRRYHDRSLELWAVRAGGNVVISLGGLALLLALVGVYGVKSYVVSQRIREFGIRVAVGARPNDVLWLVLREGLSLTAAGLAIGLPLAMLAGFGLSRLLYEVSPLDPLVFATAPLALALSATLASWVPAWRATRVAPVTALRPSRRQGVSRRERRARPGARWGQASRIDKRAAVAPFVELRGLTLRHPRQSVDCRGLTPDPTA